MTPPQPVDVQRAEVLEEQESHVSYGIGEVATPRALAPAESIEVVLDTGMEPTKNTVYAVVDDGGPVHTWLECRTDNNESQPVPFECKAPE